MQLYQFETFQMDAAERRLWCNNELISLTPKQFELLLYFVENAGRVTKKSELLDAVWADTFVEETTLARNVSWLRKKLHSHSNGEQFIETVPKLGYRFTAEVNQATGDENFFVIEEQTVQHFIAEETIQIDAEDFTRREDEEVEKLVELEYKTFTSLSAALNPSPFVSEFSLRSYASYSLFIVIGIAVLIVTSFAVYNRNGEAAGQNIGLDVNTKITIENITVGADRENVDTGIKVRSGDIINLAVVGKYQQDKDQILRFEGDKNTEGSPEYDFEKAAPRSLVGWVGNKTDRDNYFQVSNNDSVTAKKSGTLYFALNNRKNNSDKKSGEFIVTVTLNRPNVIGESFIKIGSTVNLQNRYPNEGGYLDAWGQVWSKPEFSQVPTETKFVSTHNNPNRDNGSGSWEIVSATGKSNGEPLMVGDKVHLKNRSSNGGYLDTCGWVKDMPVFKSYTDQTTAVFTTRSDNRDNGTGAWIIRSTDKLDGSAVSEGDSIALENIYTLEENGEIRQVGFLNVGGGVNTIPAFYEYDGELLIFTKDIPTGEPIPDIWTITISKASLK